jgi:hypothetical protein
VVDANYLVTNKTVLYQVEGVCLTPVNLVSNSGTAFSFHIQDASGRGIDVFHRGGFSPNLPAQGDWVRVVGLLDQFNGLTELTPSSNNLAHSLTVVSNGAALPTPRYLDMANAANAVIMEDYEGSLVVVSNVHLVTASNTFPAVAFSLILSNDANQTLTMFKPQPAVDLTGKDVPTNLAYTVRGVISQSDSTSPFSSSYQLVVTLLSDINTNAPVVPPTNPVLRIGLSNTPPLQVVVSWTADPSFILQARGDVASGIFTNVTGATSPYTNTSSGPVLHFRLQQPGGGGGS